MKEYIKPVTDKYTVKINPVLETASIDYGGNTGEGGFGGVESKGDSGDWDDDDDDLDGGSNIW